MNTVCKELSNDEKMFQMIYDMSDSAFLYYNFGEKTVKTVGSWNKFFDTGLRTSEELKKIGHLWRKNTRRSLKNFCFPRKKGFGKGI